MTRHKYMLAAVPDLTKPLHPRNLVLNHPTSSRRYMWGLLDRMRPVRRWLVQQGRKPPE